MQPQKGKAVGRAKALGLSINTKVGSNAASTASPKLSSALQSANWRQRSDEPQERVHHLMYQDFLSEEQNQQLYVTPYTAPPTKTLFSSEEIRAKPQTRQSSSSSGNGLMNFPGYVTGVEEPPSAPATKTEFYTRELQVEKSPEDQCNLGTVKNPITRRMWGAILSAETDDKTKDGSPSSVMTVTPIGSYSSSSGFVDVQNPIGELRSVGGQQRRTTETDRSGLVMVEALEPIKEESIKEESIKEESIKEESIKKESIKEESIKKESIKEESKQPDSPESDNSERIAANRNRFDSLLIKLQEAARGALGTSARSATSNALTSTAQPPQGADGDDLHEYLIVHHDGEGKYHGQNATPKVQHKRDSATQDVGRKFEQQVSVQTDHSSQMLSNKTEDGRTSSMDSAIDGCPDGKGAASAKAKSPSILNPEAVEFCFKAQNEQKALPKIDERSKIMSTPTAHASALVAYRSPCDPPSGRAPSRGFSQTSPTTQDVTTHEVTILARRVAELEHKLKQTGGGQAPAQNVANGYYPPAPSAPVSPEHMMSPVGHNGWGQGSNFGQTQPFNPGNPNMMSPVAHNGYGQGNNFGQNAPFNPGNTNMMSPVAQNRFGQGNNFGQTQPFHAGNNNMNMMPGNNMPGHGMQGGGMPGNFSRGNAMHHNHMPGNAFQGPGMHGNGSFASFNPGNNVQGNGMPGNAYPGNTYHGNGMHGNFNPGNALQGNGMPINGMPGNAMVSRGHSWTPQQTNPGYAQYPGFGPGIPLQTWTKNTFGPKPVQKPTGPVNMGDPVHAKKQQEYEEYLEYLRATDPNYADSCKQRQQRRAERQRRSGYMGPP